MANPFENIKAKDWLYVAGAFASIFALYMVLGRGKISAGDGTLTDVPNTPPADAPPNYLSYNVAPYNAPPLQTGADVSPNPSQCCCDQQCNSASPLATGDSLATLTEFYRDINPQYAALQNIQLQRYAAYFATGESYSKGGVALGVSPDAVTTGGSA